MSLVLLYIGFLLHITLMVYRSVLTGHLPLVNSYESMLLLSFIFAVRIVAVPGKTSQILIHFEKLIMLIFLLVASLQPETLRAVTPVMPALRSVWLYIHVPAYMFAYVSLLASTLLACVTLFGKKTQFGLQKQLDRNVKFTFIAMLIGITTGGIWGQVSWANYWSWDPKETWALISLLFLALSFHKDDQKFKAVMVILSALTVLFNYLAVPWILAGLHSY